MSEFQKYVVKAERGPGGIVVKLNTGETFRIDKTLLENVFDLPHTFAACIEDDTLLVTTNVGRIRLPAEPIRHALERETR